MTFTQQNDEILINVSKAELRFLYMTVYAAIEFVDDVVFATVTGLYKKDASQFLDEADPFCRPGES